ncbi:unannotated protein [freshwater metagenome]|uniref:Unannotated protein n=1 Tax=freshwater metagenome TaxID=449393 RepID=A0A6J6AQ57_9ZZZZ
MRFGKEQDQMLVPGVMQQVDEFVADATGKIKPSNGGAKCRGQGSDGQSHLLIVSRPGRDRTRDQSECGSIERYGWTS